MIEVEAQPEPEEVSPAVDSTPSEGEVLGAIVSTEEGAEIAPESFDGADQTGEEPVDSSEEVAEGGETAGATAEEDPADLVQSTTSSENIGAEIVEVEEVVPTSTPEDESPQDTLLANEAIENEESPSEDVVEESQPDYFLELTYSIAGAEPVVFGYASLEDANGKLATLPGEVVNNWNEIKNLQIGVRPVSVLSDMPTIYLESIALEVSYLEPVKPAENKNVQGLSMRSVQKNIALNPNALHLCSIEPFVVDVSGVDSTVSTLHLIKEDGFDYQIEVGSLPLGIDVALGKEGRYVHEPKKRQDDLELLITRDYGAREGSFSIPIIFTQLTEQGAESNVICQMNVVNESS